MKKIGNKSEAAKLRHKAEGLLKKKLPGSDLQLSEAGTLKLIHELEVHQIELELQNEELTQARIAQQDISDKYTELYDFAPSGYFTLSKEGKIVEVNLSGANMLDIERSRLINRLFGFFVTNDTRQIFNDFLGKVFDSKVKETCEVALSTPGNLPMYVLLTGIVTGNGEQCFATMVDVTGRAQEREYGEMSREILQVLNEPWNLKDSIRHVLAVLKKQTGFDAVGIRLQEGDDFPYFAQIGFPKDSLLTENTLIGRTVKGGICRDRDGNPCLECTCGMVISGKTGVVNPFLTPGGSFWTNDSSSLLFIPPGDDPRLHPRNICIHQGYATVILSPIRNKNRIVGLIQLNDKHKGRLTLESVVLLEGIASQIGTALMRKQAEETLRKNEAILKVALDYGKIGTWERDLKTNRLIWDSRMEKMFGLEEGTFEGTFEAFENCLVEEDIPHTREAIRKAVEENVKYETIYRVRSADGDIKYINAVGSVEHDEDGKAVKLAGVCFDITDMKKGAEEALFKLNDELLRSNKELEQFAYITSHDLQEPIRVVSSFTQLLSQRYKDKLDENGQKFIHYAVDASTRMRELIHDLLNYSRIGGRGRNFAAVDFNKVVKSTINNLTISIQEKNAVVTADKLPVIIGDEVQLVQLMQNLVGNSIKFCDTTPRVHVSAKEEPDHCLFSVKDNGTGIEEQYSDRIFLIFQRLVPKDEYGGTGIGLAICKRIVERHGGKIYFESQMGEGTTFYFTIPKNKIES